MQRRSFLRSAAALAAAAATARGLMQTAPVASPGAAGFKLRYAPHPNMFKAHAGDDLVDQISFSADQGFTAWEDNGLGRRPVEVQEKVAQALTARGMLMGVFVAMAEFKAVTFASPDPAAREKILGDIDAAIAVARRVNAKWMTVVPGCYDLKLPWDYQLANVIDNFRRCAERCEPAGVVMVMEPLNTPTNHPGVFLQDVAQAFAICRAVNSPSCKILHDLYHQQIQRGNLIPTIDLAWSETAYFQCGDNPGRKEPGTGEVNYRNVFRHLHRRGFAGVIGMEHGNSRPGREGELAVIQAYRDADSF